MLGGRNRRKEELSQGEGRRKEEESKGYGFQACHTRGPHKREIVIWVLNLYLEIGGGKCYHGERR